MCYIAGLLHTYMPAWIPFHSYAQTVSWRIAEVIFACRINPDRPDMTVCIQHGGNQSLAQGSSCLCERPCIYTQLSFKNKPRYCLGRCVIPMRWGFWRTAEDDDEARLHHLSLPLQASANCCLILFESKVSILSCVTSLPVQTQCARSCHLWMNSMAVKCVWSSLSNKVHSTH